MAFSGAGCLLLLDLLLPPAAGVCNCGIKNEITTDKTAVCCCVRMRLTVGAVAGAAGVRGICCGRSTDLVQDGYPWLQLLIFSTYIEDPINHSQCRSCSTYSSYGGIRYPLPPKEKPILEYMYK